MIIRSPDPALALMCITSSSEKQTVKTGFPRDSLKEMLVKDKLEGHRSRPGEPSDCDASLNPIEEEREGKMK